MDLGALLGPALAGAWLVGLSLAVVLLWARQARLRGEQRAMSGALEQIGRDLAAMRENLAGVARWQQVEGLRRELLEAVDVRLATKPRGGRSRTTAIGQIVSGRDSQVNEVPSNE